MVIVGPTASGKSDLAMRLARMIERAEIVTLDSMQVYRGMDIGTATPTAAEQAEVRHHLVDLVDPSEEFAVAELQARAVAVIDDIRSRDAVPVLVGGTGLYVRAVIDNLRIPERYPDVRGELEAEPDDEALHRRLVELDPTAAGRMEPTNRRRVVRALEVTIGSGRPFSSYGPGLSHYPPVPFVQVGLRWDRDRLDERIAARYRRQMAGGFLDEVRVPGRASGLPHCGPGPRLQGTARPPARRGDPGGGAGLGHRPHPPLRPPPGALVPPRPAHPLARRPHDSRPGSSGLGGNGRNRCPVVLDVVVARTVSRAESATLDAGTHASASQSEGSAYRAPSIGSPLPQYSCQMCPHLSAQSSSQVGLLELVLPSDAGLV